MATGVAVGPAAMVVVGGRACERTPGDDIGRCWGQPWVSTDGSTWEAVEAHASGLDLGRFTAALSGPEVGVEGVAYGPGGFVAFGWARSDPDSRAGTGQAWRDAGPVALRRRARLGTPAEPRQLPRRGTGALRRLAQDDRRDGGRLSARRHPLRLAGAARRHLEQPGRGHLDAGRSGRRLRHRRLRGHPGDAGGRRGLRHRRGARGQPTRRECHRGRRGLPRTREGCWPQGGVGEGVRLDARRLRRATVALRGWADLDGGPLHCGRRGQPAARAVLGPDGGHDRGTGCGRGRAAQAAGFGRRWHLGRRPGRTDGTTPGPGRTRRSLLRAPAGMHGGRVPTQGTVTLVVGGRRDLESRSLRSRRRRPTRRTSSTWTWRPRATGSSSPPASSTRQTASWSPWRWSARR